jgi:hypothetical protein
MTHQLARFVSNAPLPFIAPRRAHDKWHPGSRIWVLSNPPRYLQNSGNDFRLASAAKRDHISNIFNQMKGGGPMSSDCKGLKLSGVAMIRWEQPSI